MPLFSQRYYFSTERGPGGFTLNAGFEVCCRLYYLQRCIPFHQKVLHYYGNVLHHSHLSNLRVIPGKLPGKISRGLAALLCFP